MSTPLDTLYAWFRTRRALLDTIDQQNQIHDELSRALAAAKADLDEASTWRLRCEATQAQLDKVSDEASVSLQRIEAQAAQIASLQHAAEQYERERDAAVKERDSWYVAYHAAMGERDAARQTLDQLAAIVNNAKVLMKTFGKPES